MHSKRRTKRKKKNKNRELIYGRGGTHLALFHAHSSPLLLLLLLLVGLACTDRTCSLSVALRRAHIHKLTYLIASGA